MTACVEIPKHSTTNWQDILLPESRLDTGEHEMVICPEATVVRHAILVDNRLIEISDKVYEYIKYESEKRGVEMLDILLEEMEADRKLRENPISRDDLFFLAEATSSDLSYLEGGDESCPF